VSVNIEQYGPVNTVRLIHLDGVNQWRDSGSFLFVIAVQRIVAE
jgi:hypothetical protein